MTLRQVDSTRASRFPLPLLAALSRQPVHSPSRGPAPRHTQGVPPWKDGAASPAPWPCEIPTGRPRVRVIKDWGSRRPTAKPAAALNSHPFRVRAVSMHQASRGHGLPTCLGSPGRRSKPAEAVSSGALGHFSSKTAAVRPERPRCSLRIGCFAVPNARRGPSRASTPSVAGWLGGGVGEGGCLLSPPVLSGPTPQSLPSRVPMLEPIRASPSRSVHHTWSVVGAGSREPRCQ